MAYSYFELQPQACRLHTSRHVDCQLHKSALNFLTCKEKSIAESITGRR